MDILKLITDKDRLDFTENYDYKTSFVTSPLFPEITIFLLCT